MIVKNFKPEDGMKIVNDLVEEALNGRLTLEQFKALPEPAYTVWHEGEVVACGGMQIVGDEGIGWALFRKTMRPSSAYRVAVTVRNTVMRIIKEYGLKTVYVSAREDFSKGRRYLDFLGFENVGLIESNQPDGSETLMYVKEVA